MAVSLSKKSRSNWRLWALAGAVVLLSALSLTTYRSLDANWQDQALTLAQENLSAHEALLLSGLPRLKLPPRAAAQSELVMTLLARPQAEIIQRRTELLLTQVSLTAAAQCVVLINPAGEVLAADNGPYSDHRPDLLTANSATQLALGGMQGTTFGQSPCRPSPSRLGTAPVEASESDNETAYIVAAPVVNSDGVQGAVIAVYQPLVALNGWTGNSGYVLLLDESGQAVISSGGDWHFNWQGSAPHERDARTGTVSLSRSPAQMMEQRRGLLTLTARLGTDGGLLPEGSFAFAARPFADRWALVSLAPVAAPRISPLGGALTVLLTGACLLLAGLAVDDRLRRLAGGSHAPFADRLTGICSRDTADLAFEAAMAALRAERQTLKQILAYEGISLPAHPQDTGSADIVTGCAVAIFDIGGLHDINRRYGRREGDRLLKRIAGSVAAHTGAGDVPFRAGPDEIGVILPGRDAEGAATLARRMLDSALEQAALGRIPMHEIVIDLGVAIAHGEEDLDTACAIALDLIHDRFHNADPWSQTPSGMDEAMNRAGNTASKSPPLPQ